MIEEEEKIDEGSDSGESGSESDKHQVAFMLEDTFGNLGCIDNLVALSEGDENEKGQEETEEQKLVDEKEEKAEEVVSPTQPVIAPPLATAGTQPEQAARVPPLNLDDQKKEDGEPESASVGEVAEVEPLTESPPPLRSYEHGGPQFKNVGVELHTSSSSEGWSSSSEEEDDELPSHAGPAMLGQDIQRQDSMHMPDPAHPPPPLSSESAAKQQRTGQAGVEAKVGEAQVRPVGFRAQSPAVTGQGGIGNTGGMLQLR